MRPANSIEKKTVDRCSQDRRYCCGLVVAPQCGRNCCRDSACDQQKFRQSKQGEADGRWKQQRQIFGPAFAQLREAAVHAGAHRVAAKAEENLAARSFHRLGQRDVFQQTIADRRVSTDCVVGFASDQDVLAIGRGCRRPGIADQRRLVCRRQFGENDRHHRLFPEPVNFLLGE